MDITMAHGGIKVFNSVGFSYHPLAILYKYYTCASTLTNKSTCTSSLLSIVACWPFHFMKSFIQIIKYHNRL